MGVRVPGLVARVSQRVEMEMLAQEEPEAFDDGQGIVQRHALQRREVGGPHLVVRRLAALALLQLVREAWTCMEVISEHGERVAETRAADDDDSTS